ncbi:MAG: DUF2269 family protein [Actinomycetota bacterium]
MFEWSTLWLILHILAVIVAWGPTFVFGIIGAAIQKDPQHALFGVRLSNTIEKRLVIPAFTLAPLFGAALIFTRRYEFWKSTWLLAATGLFLVAYTIGVGPSRINGHRIQEKLEGMMEGKGGPETIAEVQAMGKRSQMLGIAMAVLTLGVLVLMIWKPGSCFVGQTNC